MDGVEDIPTETLRAGIDFKWESFGEYLDALSGMKRVLDVGTHVPHCAVRAYVMGERGANNEEATPEDIARMAAVVRDGVKAGALGVSTSRTLVHRLSAMAAKSSICQSAPPRAFRSMAFAPIC
jgi:N-acyl-D-aspartate/D-glutamate deacylase